MAITIFILGTIIGSFLNVCIYRLPKKMSLSVPRSHCPSCGQVLGPLDLVPIISFMAFRGRCRTCQAPISHRYWLVELASGLVFLAIYLRFGLGLQALITMIMASLLLVGWLIIYDKQPLNLGLGLSIFLLSLVALVGQAHDLNTTLSPLAGGLLGLLYALYLRHIDKGYNLFFMVTGLGLFIHLRGMLIILMATMVYFILFHCIIKINKQTYKNSLALASLIITVLSLLF